MAYDPYHFVSEVLLHPVYIWLYLYQFTVLYKFKLFISNEEDKVKLV